MCVFGGGDIIGRGVRAGWDGRVGGRRAWGEAQLVTFLDSLSSGWSQQQDSQRDGGEKQTGVWGDGECRDCRADINDSIAL
jgi:hypothetical protein